MLAEFISQPTSGQFEEISFELETNCKSTNWCWVRFITDDVMEWIGSFRGKAVKTALAEKTKQAAVLTEDCIYILDINKKELLFHQSQTQYRDLCDVPSKDRFIVVGYYEIVVIDRDYNFHSIETDHQMDNIKFKNYDGGNLDFDFKQVPDYSSGRGIIDTKSWKIIIH